MISLVNINHDKYLLFLVGYYLTNSMSLLRTQPEVEFVHAVSAGGSVKFLPAV